jgi:hypothetical protein
MPAELLLNRRDVGVDTGRRRTVDPSLSELMNGPLHKRFSSWWKQVNGLPDDDGTHWTPEIWVVADSSAGGYTNALTGKWGSATRFGIHRGRIADCSGLYLIRFIPVRRGSGHDREQTIDTLDGSERMIAWETMQELGTTLRNLPRLSEEAWEELQHIGAERFRLNTMFSEGGIAGRKLPKKLDRWGWPGEEAEQTDQQRQVWEIVCASLWRKHRFVRECIQDRMELMNLTAQGASLRDGLLKAYVWVDIEKQEAGLEKDGLWTKELMAEYRSTRSPEALRLAAARESAKRCGGSPWVQAHTQELLDLYKAGCGSDRPVCIDILDLMRRTADDQDWEDMLIAARSNEERAVALATFDWLEGYAKETQDADFMDHPNFGEAVELAVDMHAALPGWEQDNLEVRLRRLISEIDGTAWLQMSSCLSLVSEKSGSKTLNVQT